MVVVVLGDVDVDTDVVDVVEYIDTCGVVFVHRNGYGGRVVRVGQH